MIYLTFKHEDLPDHVFGSKPLTPYELRGMMDMFLLPKEKLHYNEYHSDKKFELDVETKQRAADFLSMVFFRGKSSTLVRFPKDLDRRRELLGMLVSLEPSDYLIINITDRSVRSSGPDFGAQAHALVVDQKALKLKLQF